MPCVITQLADRQYTSILILQNLKYITGKLHTLIKALSIHDISGMKVLVFNSKQSVHNFQKCLVL